MQCSPDQVTIVLPTLGRKDLATKAVQKIRETAKFGRLLVVVNNDRWRTDLPDDLAVTGEHVRCEANAGVTRAVEAGVLAAVSPFICVVYDDIEIPEEGWLERACKVYREKIGDRDGVVALNDGIRSDIACFPLMARQFYMDHLFPVPYRRYYADTELGHKAQALGVYAVATDAVVRHMNIGKHDADALRSEGRIFLGRMEEFHKRFPSGS